MEFNFNEKKRASCRISAISRRISRGVTLEEWMAGWIAVLGLAGYRGIHAPLSTADS
jgi:hypothetical protein